MNQSQSNPGVIAVVIDGKDMANPMVRGLPDTLKGMISALGIKAQVVTPEAVHTDEDSNVAMSRNIDHLNDGPGCCDQRCDACGVDDVPLTLLDSVNQSTDSAEMLIAFCKVDAQFIMAGVPIESRYSVPGVEAPEHFLFNRACWVAEAEEGETVLGYWPWVEEQVKIVLRAAFDEGYMDEEDTEVVIGEAA